jgi:hypothetical protein
MAIVVTTSKPGTLLADIRGAIDAGAIDTWAYDKDGDFTHSPDQWKNQAWFRPVVQAERLVFRIIPPKSTHISRTVYGVYHGRFIEMLLSHFDLSFSRAVASALPEQGDVIS